MSEPNRVVELPESVANSKSGRFSVFIHDNPDIAWTSSGTLVLATTALVPWMWIRIVLIVVGVGLTGRGLLKAKKRDDSITKLELERSSQKSDKEDLSAKLVETYGYFEEVLKGIITAQFKHSKLSTDERITVYLHWETLDQFTAIFRVSGNPDFRKVVRDLYPKETGIIGKAWADEQAEEVLSSNINETRADFERRLCDKWGFPQEIAKKIRMESKTLFAARIDDREHTAIGVIVVESKTPDNLKLKEVLDAIMENEVLIANVVRYYSKSLEDPSAVSQKGF